ncbi:MAG: dUTP diphosphatase [Paracoccus sp. (in: a-proteobacteria)]|uniref:dUTP diphosphatase n=1 Tax=Paracoccus sp. TaxID=267 RepID=UPI0026DFAA6D|nr:dUTP diphosphatase [Paracoccus sp. (in: a-proteobacteria)]MDO5631318.1 dUTP diphosphatase [Paracoccus sp. (in: a-proteobacteria)]
MSRPIIRVMRDTGADVALPLPSYATAGAAGADLRADLGGSAVTLMPGERRIIPTGLRVQIPDGWEIQIRPRSGLALKSGLSLPNTPGTIDSDYRGPLGVLMINLDGQPQTITHGERIAQMIVAPAPQARFELVTELDDSERGQGGFGSTGRG